MTLLIATHNKSKLERYQRILKDIPGLKLLSLMDLKITAKADEPFKTALENARYKAEFYGKMTNLLTLAIDEAATTNFLPEDMQPGVYVRRFVDKDKEMTDLETLKVWKNLFKKFPKKNKEFIWDFSIAFYNPQRSQTHTTQAVMISSVAPNFSEKIQPGYPMSSFLIPIGANKTYVELSEQEQLQVDRHIFADFINEFPSWI